MGGVATLDRPCPPPPLESIRRVVAEAYGKAGGLRRLSGERDGNLLLTCADGRAYLVKISHPDERTETIDGQSAALRHIEAVAPDLPVQRLIAAGDGRWRVTVEREGARAEARLFTFIPGRPLHGTTIGPELAREVGRGLGGLGRALNDFDHPGAHRDLVWDLRRIERLRDLLPAIREPGRAALAGRLLASAACRLEAVLPRLRTQVVHHDLNPANIIVDPTRPGRIEGLLDFGDMLHAPLAADVAIAAAYHVGTGEDALALVAALVSGYRSVIPLQELEIDHLVDLVAVRLVAIVAVGARRARDDIGNVAYLQRNSRAAWSAIAWLAAVDLARSAGDLRDRLG